MSYRDAYTSRTLLRLGFGPGWRSPEPWSLVVFYDSAAAPCGCVIHRGWGVDCTVAIHAFWPGFYAVCLSCMSGWLWRVRRGHYEGSLLSHPMELVFGGNGNEVEGDFPPVDGGT